MIKKIQSIDSLERYGANKDLKCKTEEIKHNHVIKQYEND